VKVRFGCNVFSKNLGACRRPECVFVGAKKDLAIPWLRVKPKEGPERPAMYDTKAVMVFWRKSQRVNVVAP
jgi:hypothetical protein